MQSKRVLWLIAGSLAAVAVGVGCGGNGTGAGARCTSDSNCAPDEVCHPNAKVCVTKCTTANDCGDEAKRCDLIGSISADGGTQSTTSTQKACHCSTDALCAKANPGDICSTLDRVCTPKCTKDDECGGGGRTCDTATGQCKAGAAGNCAQGTCTGGNVCNFTTGACEAAKTCTSTAQQPDTCSYGQFCASGNKCSEVAKPTCGAFTGSAHATSWGVGKNGPVVFDMVKDSYQAPGNVFCANATHARYKAKISVYDPAGGLPTATCSNSGEAHGSEETALEGMIHLVDADGNEISPNLTVQCVNTSTDKKSATFYVNFCSASTTGYTAAIHFVNGNEQCATVNP